MVPPATKSVECQSMFTWVRSVDPEPYAPSVKPQTAKVFETASHVSSQTIPLLSIALAQPNKTTQSTTKSSTKPTVNPAQSTRKFTANSEQSTNKSPSNPKNRKSPSTKNNTERIPKGQRNALEVFNKFGSLDLDTQDGMEITTSQSPAQSPKKEHRGRSKEKSRSPVKPP